MAVGAQFTEAELAERQKKADELKRRIAEGPKDGPKVLMHITHPKLRNRLASTVNVDECPLDPDVAAGYVQRGHAEPVDLENAPAVVKKAMKEKQQRSPEDKQMRGGRRK